MSVHINTEALTEGVALMQGAIVVRSEHEAELQAAALGFTRGSVTNSARSEIRLYGTGNCDLGLISPGEAVHFIMPSPKRRAKK